MTRHEDCSPADERLIPAFILRGFWDELEKRGISSTEFERASHVSRPQPDDFSSLISESAMYALFEAAQAITGDPAIGLSAGRALGTSGFHLMGHLALAANNLAQAVELLVRAQPQIAARAVLEERGDGLMRFGFRRTDENTTPGVRVKSELSAVLLHDVVRHYFLPGTREAPRVELAFPPPINRAPYESAFPGGVEFGGQGTFVIFPRAALAVRRSGADPWLRDQLFELALDRYGTAQDADESWTGRVRRALRMHAAPRLLNVSVLAQQLGVSRRGLTRRLASEGITVSELIDQALFERAQPLLRRPGVTATQVAEALGYAELSSFFRAFRRWSGGLTPSAYRRRHDGATESESVAGPNGEPPPKTRSSRSH